MTNKTALTTQEVAARFNELFSDNVRRPEPTNSPDVKYAKRKSFVQKKGGGLMRKIQTIAVIVGILFSFAASSQNKQTLGVMNKMEPLLRDLEIQLALSALPPHLRDSATVYVLTLTKALKLAARVLMDSMPLLREQATMQ